MCETNRRHTPTGLHRLRTPSVTNTGCFQPSTTETVFTDLVLGCRSKQRMGAGAAWTSRTRLHSSQTIKVAGK